MSTLEADCDRFVTKESFTCLDKCHDFLFGYWVNSLHYTRENFFPLETFCDVPRNDSQWHTSRHPCMGCHASPMIIVMPIAMGPAWPVKTGNRLGPIPWRDRSFSLQREMYGGMRAHEFSFYSFFFHRSIVTGIRRPCQESVIGLPARGIPSVSVLRGSY